MSKKGRVRKKTIEEKNKKRQIRANRYKHDPAKWEAKKAKKNPLRL